MKEPNPSSYVSEQEYEKAQSQYEDYAEEKYEQKKDFHKGGYIENAEQYVGVIVHEQHIEEKYLEKWLEKDGN